MISKLWQWAAAGLGAVAVVLYGLMKRAELGEVKAEVKADRAKRKKEAAEHKATELREHAEVNKRMQERANERIRKAKAVARTGSRDHFDRGMHDD